MTRIEFAPEVREDIDRIIEHLEKFDASRIEERIDDIIDAIAILERNPNVGRPGRGELKELIVGRDATGYVALYRYIPEIDIVFVLAIRSQREAGYKCS